MPQLLEGWKLNQADIQEMMIQLNLLVNSHVSAALQEASRLLNEAGCTQMAVVQSLIEAHSSEEAPNVFEKLKTKYRRDKFFMQKIGLIQRRLVKLPPRDDYFGRSRTGCPQMQKAQTYITISLVKQLELLLSQEDIFSQVFGNKPEYVPGVYSRFEDGSLYRTSELFVRHPTALQINLYLDEAQVCDPLGSKTINNKLVFVIFRWETLISSIVST